MFAVLLAALVAVLVAIGAALWLVDARARRGGLPRLVRAVARTTLAGPSSGAVVRVQHPRSAQDATDSTVVIEAVEEAATLRLRPILMTTGAMVLGALPLATAHGAGHEPDRAEAARTIVFRETSAIGLRALLDQVITGLRDAGAPLPPFTAGAHVELQLGERLIGVVDAARHGAQRRRHRRAGQRPRP